MSKPREYRRTCERCGTTWYVPAELAGPRNKGEERAERWKLAGARMGAAGSSMTIFGALRGFRPSRSARAEVDRLEARRDRVLEARRCPSCGSVSYREDPA